MVISPRTNTLTHCAENYFKELQFQQGLGYIYQPSIDCFSTMQVSNRSLLYCCTVWNSRSQTNLDELFKLQKRYARLILDSPRDARSYDNFQKLKWLPADQLFKLNKHGLLKKVIDGRAPEYLITTLDSLRFEHKYSRTKPLYRLPKPRTEAMRRTFF